MYTDNCSYWENRDKKYNRFAAEKLREYGINKAYCLYVLQYNSVMWPNRIYEWKIYRFMYTLCKRIINNN